MNLTLLKSMHKSTITARSSYCVQISPGDSGNKGWVIKFFETQDEAENYWSYWFDPRKKVLKAETIRILRQERD